MARGAASGTSEQLLERAAKDVRDPQRRIGQRVDERVGDERLEHHAVPARILARDGDRDRVDVARVDGCEPEAQRRDRQDAGATAEVEQRAARGEGREQLERGERGRVAPGPERAAGIDHDRGDAGGCALPRRPDPEAAGDHAAAMELAPALGPVALDRLDLPGAEVGRQLVGRCGVRDDLQPPIALELLEPARKERARPRTERLDRLGSLRARTRQGADGHENARRIASPRRESPR